MSNLPEQNRGMAPAAGGAPARVPSPDRSNRQAGDHYFPPEKKNGLRDRLATMDIYAVTGQFLPATRRLSDVWKTPVAPTRPGIVARLVNNHYYDSFVHWLATAGVLAGFVYGAAHIEAVPKPNTRNPAPDMASAMGTGSTFEALLKVDGDPNHALFREDELRLTSFALRFNDPLKRAQLITDLKAYAEKNYGNGKSPEDYARYTDDIKKLEDCPVDWSLGKCVTEGGLKLNIPKNGRPIMDDRGSGAVEAPAIGQQPSNRELRRVSAGRENGRATGMKASSTNRRIG